MEDIQKILQQ